MNTRATAQKLAQKGRYGDSVLVHMSPEEVYGLQALAQRHGTSLSINPYTGLPEAFKLKKIFRPIEKAVSSIGSAVGDVLKPVAKVIAPLAPILPFIPIPGIGPLSSLAVRSLLAGGLGGLSGGRGFDPKRALLSGLTAYGIGSLMNPATAAGTAGPGGFDMGGVGDAAGSFGIPDVAPSGIPVPTSGVDISPISSAGDYTYTASGAPAAPATVDATSVPADVGGAFDMGADGIGAAYTPPTPTGAYDISGIGGAYDAQTAGAPIFSAPTAPAADYSGIRGLDAAGERYGDAAMNLLSAAGDTALTQVTEKPLQTAMAGFGVYSGIKTKEELENQRQEAERILRDQENQSAAKVAYAQGILRDYPLLYKQLTAEDVRSMNLAGGGLAYDDEYGSDDALAMGGLAALAKGGALPPRFLSGGGDGMSDSIPARIGGKQEARLADGEFVVPADVVSHLGNGSSKAGAKKLYAMMDRARQARTGQKRQAPAIKAERVMPA